MTNSDREYYITTITAQADLVHIARSARGGMDAAAEQRALQSVIREAYAAGLAMKHIKAAFRGTR